MIILNKWSFNSINKEKELFAKIIYTVCIIIVDIFLIVYYLDRLNLPTVLKISENINTQNWLNNRIQNMPLMTYNFHDKKDNGQLVVLDTNIEDGTLGDIFFSIKNVGLNSGRNINIKIQSDILKNDIDKNYYVLEKDKIEYISYVGYFNLNTKYNFRIKVSYQDLLFNVYEQEIEFNYELTSYVKESQREYIIDNAVIKKEEFIEEEKA